eukprot:1791222-Rhodomonas_salina.8
MLRTDQGYRPTRCDASGRFVHVVLPLNTVPLLSRCAWYAMPGTKIAHGTTTKGLRARYALTGTDTAYGATRASTAY